MSAVIGFLAYYSLGVLAMRREWKLELRKIDDKYPELPASEISPDEWVMIVFCAIVWPVMLLFLWAKASTSKEEEAQ